MKKDLIKAVVDKHDPECLLSAGCPDDEYDPEIKMLFSRIRNDMTDQEIAEIIHAVFLKMFDDSLDAELCHVMACEMLAMTSSS